MKTEEGASDEFIYKLKNGMLLAKFDIFVPLRNYFTDDEIIAIPRLYLYVNDFENKRISEKEEMYRMFSFKGRGIIIFKYSKIEQ